MKKFMEMVINNQATQGTILERINATTTETNEAVKAMQPQLQEIYNAVMKKQVNKVVAITKCDRCGYEIKSEAVINYCKNSRHINGVYCPKCQAELGYASKNSKYAKAEQPKTLSSVKHSCAYCGKVLHFDSTEHRTTFYNKCIEKGYKGCICTGCHKKQEAITEVDIQVPSVERKVMHNQIEFEERAMLAKEQDRVGVIDTTQGVVTFLIGRGYGKEEIAQMKIGDARKIADANNCKIELDGNNWNRNKQTVVEQLYVEQQTFTMVDGSDVNEEEEQNF